MGGIGGQFKGLAEQARLGTGAALVADVNCGRRVVAHQNGGQAGRDLVLLLHLGDAGSYFGADFFG